MIRVVGINGSPRKNGDTAKLLKKVLAECRKAGARTELINLADKDIRPCAGCLAEGKCGYPCRIKDDMQALYKIVEKADCLVLAAPTYWYGMSGLMKNFIDRATALDLVEPSLLDGKVLGVVATAGLDGSAQTITQMAMPFSSMGAILVPYSDVFISDKKLWRAEFGVKPDVRLARNLVELARLTKDRQKKWFFSGKRKER